MFGAVMLRGAAFGAVDLNGPLYQDQTPLCHYLERGIDDLAARKRDLHVVLAPGVESLAQVDHLTLGLDLPYTRCRDDPRSHPCADEDHPTHWCVRTVELWVGDTKLFERSEPGGCALQVGAGLDGMRTITGPQLRAHPLWGFTIPQLLEYLPYLEPGTFRLKAPGLHYTAEYFAWSLEGIIGDYKARANKGCANGTYCGNKRGINVRFARAGKVDCDLGGCPAKRQRRSSPWLELEGQGKDRLEVDIDLEIFNSTFDPGDCVDEAPGGAAKDCGNLETALGRGSLELLLRFPCVEKARVQIPGKGFRNFPYCPEGSPSPSPCFRLTGPVLPTWAGGVIECPGDVPPGESFCGQSVILDGSRFDQSVALAEPAKFDAEGGLIVQLLEFFCALTAPEGDPCPTDLLATLALRSRLDASMFNQTMLRDLPGCPVVGVSSRGDVAIDMRVLDACPPGA